jgi:hypothetical protein
MARPFRPGPVTSTRGMRISDTARGGLRIVDGMARLAGKGRGER